MKRYFIPHRHYSNRRGQSLVELLIAVGVGAVMILGAITLIAPALQASSQVAQAQTAGAGAWELMNNVRGWSENDWHNLYNLSKTSSSPYFMIAGTSTIAAATGTESVPSDGVTSGLVGAWRFDEATGTTAYDWSGNGYNATVLNDLTRTSGKVGGALLSGGNTAQVIPGNSAALNYTGGGLTLSAWIKPDPADNGGYLISKPWNGSGQYNYSLSTSNGASPTLTFLISGATAYSITTVQTISSGVWHHVAATVDAAKNVVLYIDGAVSRSGVHAISSWVPSSGDAGISAVFFCIFPYGNNSCAGATTYDFNGAMDDVRIYNRALSLAEIQKIYGGGFYKRYFYVENVARNASGYIDPSGGIDDPSTQKVTVVYSWPSLSAPRSFVSYLTRYASRVAEQTDWTGAGGQSTSTKNFGNAFASSTNVDLATSTGSIVIQGY
jgi:Tfp pilus assembly protein PilV